jgi:formylglycine-generating enzyme required for sulfatase activity
VRVAAVFLVVTSAFAADFRKDIQPLLEQNCTACHGAVRQSGGIRLDTPSGFEKANPKSVLAAVEGGRMPPGEKLAPNEQAALREWVNGGASWPAGLVVATGGAGAGGADNLSLARKIHDKIVATSGGTSAAKAYHQTIPRTDVAFDMVAIPGGEFAMGTPDSESGRKKDEGPVHKVRIEPFWMSAHEVTWDEYRLFMFAKQAGESGLQDPQVDAVSRPTRPYVEMSFGMGINGYPAISMTQHAANKYAEWLSAKTGQFYRLPTEAEWEYACRAGSTTAFPWGDDASKLSEYAWFNDNADGKYQKVATKKPNAWGLYDMLGNVMEWTLDQYAAYANSADPVTEPWVKATKPYPHAVRGGSWADVAEKCRCGSRVGSDATWKQQDPQLPKSIWYHTDAQGLGFRLVRPVRIPDAEAMYRYWNNGVEHDQ